MSPRHLIWLLALWPAGASAADWSVSLSGGLATIAGEGEQPFASLGLYRYFGDGFVRANVAWFDGEGEPGVAEPLPARTRQVTIGGGYQAGRVLLDAYATLGSRDFTPPAPARTNGRVVRDDSKGSLFTLGGSVTWDAPAGESWSIAPFVSLSYSALDTARTLVPPAGDPVIAESRESGLTGIAGVSAERIWRGGSLGVYLAAAATSNRASINRQGSGLAASRTPQLIPAEDDGDAWLEYGISGSIQLSPDISLDALLVRTAGFDLGETTSASTGVRIQF
jgi:autotransporter-like protein